MTHGSVEMARPELVAEQLAESRTAYDRIAPVYDLVDAVYERSWKYRLRRILFSHARGRLLDVGVGTGCNMPFYPPGSTVVGIDASRAMLEKARRRAGRLGLAVELHEMNLLALGFDDATFDTVAVTFVLLCLPDELQAPALAELRRVLKPDGRLLLLDYHRSTRTAVRWWTRVLSRWLRWAFAARFDPATERFVERSGLEVVERQSFLGDAVTMLVLRPRAG
jgi:phosphatidylethanolamine/phosphatidyl-N-methylethanolamine N-methyltransferase